MHFQALALLGAVGAAQAAASGSACAQVSASSASQVAAHPSATPTVSAKLAHDCLTSAALNKSDALKLMDDLMPFVEWQTTTSYLKNPPSGYKEPGVDIYAELNGVQTKIKNGTYANEYEFEADIFRVFNLAHDGHFRYMPNLISGALTFARPAGLVSVSLDGSEVPQIYLRDDIKAFVQAGKKNVSSITKINGEDAMTYIQNLSQLGALQDPDALYNSMFYTKPFAAVSPGWNGYFSGSGRFGNIFPGLNTTIDFKNGSKITLDTYSKVVGDFSGVTDGASLYKKFCSGTAAKASEVAAPAAPAAAPPVPGYPKPVIATNDSIVSGYYLNSTQNSDVAVLSLLAMESESPAEFQHVVQQFFADAVKAGKKKLVVDLSANGGGYILQGYDTFRLMFPHIVQDGYTRWKYSEGFEAISSELTNSLKNYNPKNATTNEIEVAESTVFWKYDYNLTDQPFPSPQAKFGPHEFNGDNFTSVMRWNLNDPLTTTSKKYGMGIEITGYGSRQNFTQPFQAADIILLYDGYCASTCTLLSEFLRTQGNVKSIAIGGRPSNDAMQGIGGTKGANNADFSYQNFLAQFAYNHLDAAGKNSSQGKTLQSYLSKYAFNRATDTSINLRDNILPGHLQDQTPAQFIYEAADCRLFYQPGMVVNVAEMWEAAADAAWGSKACVNGKLDLPKRTITSAPQVEGGNAPVITNPQSFPSPDKTSIWSALHGRKVPL